MASSTGLVKLLKVRNIQPEHRTSSLLLMHLSSSSPRGGKPRVAGGGIGDFVGILQHICVPVVAEMKGLCQPVNQSTSLGERSLSMF